MNLSHPNAQLSVEVVERAVTVAANAFRRCLMEPIRPPVDRFDCNSFLYGELGQKRFLVYVRITLDDEKEEGVGPIPSILIDAACQIEAEPHLIRVHMREVGKGIAFSYFGYEEFIQSVLSNSEEWNARLIAPKTFADFFRFLNGKISQIRLDVDYSATALYEENTANRCVALKLAVDGNEPYAGTIDPGELLSSTVQGDEYEIFTCSCGHAGCARIWKGVIVAHQDTLVLWKAYHAKGRKIFLFDKEEYRSEILTKCGEAIRFVRGGDDRFFNPYEHRFKHLEKAYYLATEKVAEATAPELLFVREREK